MKKLKLATTFKQETYPYSTIEAPVYLIGQFAYAEYDMPQPSTTLEGFVPVNYKDGQFVQLYRTEEHQKVLLPLCPQPHQVSNTDIQSNQR